MNRQRFFCPAIAICIVRRFQFHIRLWLMINKTNHCFKRWILNDAIKNSIVFQCVTFSHEFPYLHLSNFVNRITLHRYRVSIRNIQGHSYLETTTWISYWYCAKQCSKTKNHQQLLSGGTINLPWMLIISPRPSIQHQTRCKDCLLWTKKTLTEIGNSRMSGPKMPPY